MSLTPDAVRAATFDKAPFGRRGYHEDQVDDFLDRIEATLAGRGDLTAAAVRTVEFDSSPLVKRGYNEDQVDDFLDRVVEVLVRREKATSGGLDPITVAIPVVVDEPSPPEAAPEPVPGPAPEPPVAVAGPAPDSPVSYLPLPPAPAGVRGYRPGDVERLARLLARAAGDPVEQPTSAELAATKLGLTFFTGQGYHPKVVDTLVESWVDELRRREQ